MERFFNKFDSLIKIKTNKTVYQRFIDKIEKRSTGCWEWTASKTSQGYGYFTIRGIKAQSAHRLSFAANFGPIPEGACVLHRCDNPACVNPDHLFLGTRDDNNKDRAKKGRTVTPNMNLTECKRGHLFDEMNTLIRPNGTRLCRKCNAEQTLIRYHRNKQ